MEISEYNTTVKPTWCPGCGNFTIHMSLKKAFVELNLKPSDVYMAFDIGCNGNGADKIKTYRFKGLHGRSIPLAVGAHLANRRMKVIADIGDGGCFHEGLDHIVHAIRSNYDITILIHNNQNFALTTGQATVSTDEDKPMYGLPDSKPERSLDIPTFLLSLKPSFYARAYSGDPVKLTEIIKDGLTHKGCSVIEIVQLCPTYNEEMTPEWFAQRIKNIEYNENRTVEEAQTLFKQAKDQIPLGIVFKDKTLPTYYDSLENRKGTTTELVDEVKSYDISQLFNQFK